MLNCNFLGLRIFIFVSLQLLLSKSFAQVDSSILDRTSTQVFTNGNLEANSNMHVSSDGWIFFSCEIEGKVYRFLFDSGAQISVLNSRIFNDTSTVHALITDLSGNESTSKMVTKSVKFGGFEFQNVSFVVSDLSQIENNSCEKIDGVLGSNALSLLNWKIDPTLTLLSCSFNPYPASSTSSSANIEFTNETLPLVQVNIGKTKFWALLDTGNTTTINLTSEVVSSEKSLRKAHKLYGEGISSIAINGSLNATKSELIFVDEVRIDDILLTNVNAFVTTAKPAIGVKTFINGILILNFTEKKMYFNRQNEISSDYFQSYGFNLCYDTGKGVNFCFLWEDSNAKRAGLSIGDILLSVDDISLTEINEQKFCDLKKQLASSRKIEIEILSKGKIRKLKLEKKPLDSRKQ